MLRRIFGSKRDEVTGEWRKLRSEELCYLYSSPNTVRVIKSRRMKWPGHVARMGERTGLYTVWWRNLKEKYHLEDQNVDGRIILRRIFKKWDLGVWTRSIWIRIRTGGGHL